MKWFGIAAFLAAFFITYFLAGPGTPLVIPRALGGALVPFGISMLVAIKSRRGGSKHPYMWGGLALAFIMQLMILGSD